MTLPIRKHASYIHWFWLCLLTFPGTSEAADQCVKLVFEDYCLGGSMSRQLEKTPTDMRPQVYGERKGVIFEMDNEKIYVMSYKGIIYKILHTFEPETQATLKDLRRRLERKYGRFEDRSEYPEETENKARHMSFIRRGEGELKNVWQLPDQQWRVELGWSRKLGVSVAYYMNELDELQKEAALKGL
ncbi:MAG: hypothetical protein QNJ78_07800 [Gammaproteobacteria bacterium]|nr:hypothetical protein [Gammaproteobacteria bacterium]